ncbi:RNA-directed DNA polymerase [Hansschlegelia beijingensis]
MGANEALSPKGRLSFRVAHQLPALENVLFLACVLEIGGRIQAYRNRLGQETSFSYHFQNSGEGSIFRDGHTYRDWCMYQRDVLDHDPGPTHVLEVDVADFYARISFHRLENLLDQVAPRDGAVRFIKKQIKAIRARQSFGLPVGGSASRLLAELALTDTDQALADRQIRSTRYVDDFRILVRSEREAYDVAAFIAEQLGISEGLSLNAAKTRIYSREAYREWLDSIIPNVEDVAGESAIEQLTSSIYFDMEPDEEEIEALRNVNILEYLDVEIQRHIHDTGRVRTIFRALRIILPLDAIGYIRQNFEVLTLYSKELCLLMQGVATRMPGCFDDMGIRIVGEILRPPASSVQVMRSWLIELFVRGIVSPTQDTVRQLEPLSSVSDRRQILLIRGRIGDINFFRRNKTAVTHFAPQDRACLVLGGSCLPEDEYNSWLGAVRPLFNTPLGGLFLAWARRNRGVIFNRLTWHADDHPD